MERHGENALIVAWMLPPPPAHKHLPIQRGHSPIQHGHSPIQHGHSPIVYGHLHSQVRMERHGENALAVARMLEAHPMVESIFYPGLESHPDHTLAKKVFTSGILYYTTLYDTIRYDILYYTSLHYTVLYHSLAQKVFTLLLYYSPQAALARRGHKPSVVC